MKKFSSVVVIIVIVCFVSAAFAQAPQKFNFQGKLTDPSGNPLNIPTGISMTFTIYDADTDGNELWTETQTVPVNDGVYNVMLGEVEPIDTEITGTIPLWLGVQVGADAEMSPLVELTPGPYTMILMNQISVENGNIGIKTSTPQEELDVNGHVKAGPLTIGPWPSDPNSYAFLGTNALDQTNNVNYALLQQNTGNTYLNSPEDIRFRINNSDKMYIANNGNVGIGMTTPIYQLHVSGAMRISGDDLADGGKFSVIREQESTKPLIRFEANNTDRGISIVNHGRHTVGNYPGFVTITQTHPETVYPPLVVSQYGVGRIFEAKSSSSQIEFQIDKNGNTTIHGTLYVSGGVDLAEPFDMTDIHALELGDVVVIDPQNPLHVTKSTTAYAPTVAGIVSSTKQAGYVAGSRSDGTSDKPVALAGRVMCKVSTENGAIRIGDMLTTSSIPGHAMKATDRDKAFGAVLGKALQAFDGETGQIMVLVALQ